MPKEIILSLSKKKGDFVMSTARSGGHGGQNVNKRDTKVTITHTASGATGTSETYKTQGRNKIEAFRRLVEGTKFKAWLRLELARRGVQRPSESQHGPTGDRGHKIRTYNVPRDEVIDHRTGSKTKGVHRILDGDLDAIVEELRGEEVRCVLIQN